LFTKMCPIGERYKSGPPLTNGRVPEEDSPRQESFKALASDTRIEILKRLDASQRTVTDLANELKVNKSAVYKHLSRLLDAGLVKKVEDNRKWVYYACP